MVYGFCYSFKKQKQKKRQKKLVKQKVSKNEKPKRPQRSLSKVEHVIGCACEEACVKLGNVNSVEKFWPGRTQLPHKPTSAQRLKVTMVTADSRLCSPEGYGLTGQ